MAGINEHFNRQPVTFDFLKPPIQAIAIAAESRQRQFDENEGKIDDILSRSIEALEVDRPRANTILQEYRTQIDEIIGNVDGDLSRAGNQLRKLTNQITRDFNPGGEAHAIQANKLLFTDYLDRNRKNLNKKDGIRGFQLNMAHDFILGNFEGTGFNPSTGTFNQIDLPEINPHIDLNNRALDTAEKIVPTVIEQGYEFVDGQWIRKVNGKTEILTPERIKRIVMNEMMTSGDVQAYIQQLGQFSGQDFSPLIEDAANIAADTFMRQNVSQTTGIKANPFAIQDRIDARQQREHQFQTAVHEVRDFAISRASNNGKLNQSILKGSLDHVDVGQTQRSNPFEPRVPITVDESKRTQKQYQGYGEMLQDSKGINRLKRSNVNISLLQTIVEDNPGASNEEIERLYEQSRNNFNADQTTFIQVSNPVSNQYTESLIRTGEIFNKSVKFISSTGQVSDSMSMNEAMDEFDISRDAIVDPKTGKPLVRVSGIQMASEGTSNLGLRIPVGGGVLVVEDSLPTHVHNIYQPISDLSQVAYDPDMNVSPHAVEINGPLIMSGFVDLEPTWVKARKEIRRTSTGYVPVVELYETDRHGNFLPDENGQITPLINPLTGQPLTPKDIERDYNAAGILRNVMPRGASRSDNVRHNPDF